MTAPCRSEAAVALHARVSTTDKGQDPETQLRPLCEYATRRGFALAEEYVDHGSGRADDRTAYRRLLVDARRCRFDVVLVWRDDRFARSTPPGIMYTTYSATMMIDRIAPVLVAILLLAGCRPGEEGPSTPAQDLPSAVDTTAMRVGETLGQMVYVPVYSHIYHQDGSREFNLTATLSIRNTDPEHPITITAVRYYDSAGSLVRTYLGQPIELAPLASRPFVVEERDKAGGVGANFIVEWRAEAEVSLPIIEAIMISTAGTQGISFVTRGQVVRPLGENADRENRP